MSQTGQEMVFKRLMTRRAVECDDEDDNATKDDALSLLTFFDADTFSQQAFINRVLKSPAVQSSGSLFPRNKGGFETLSAPDKANVTSVMTDLAKAVAEILMSKDDAALLLKRMVAKPSRGS